MSRTIKFVSNQYEVVAFEQEKSIGIYLLNPTVRRKLRTPMVFSYDGTWWSKTAGGRAVKFDELVDIVGLDKEVVEFIESFFGEE